MRKIREHILEGKEIFVGLEDSKRTWKLCVRSEQTVVHETTMPAQYEALSGYFRNRFPDCTIHVIYEAGFRGFGLHDQLVGDGWDCVVTPPHTVTDEKCQRKKNDRIDCRRLAKNRENGDYKSCFVPDPELREDRQVSRVYGQLMRDTVRVSNRIRRVLEFHGLDQQFAPGKWTTARYRELQQGLGQMGLSDSLQFSLEILLTEWEQLRGLRKRVLSQLRTLARSERYRSTVNLLKSAPGVGLLTAIRLALEWGDVRRFARKENFASFLGLTPAEYSTGETERKGHITKQGNPGPRTWLVESSWVAIKYDPVLLEKYQNVYRSSGKKKVAIVAVARKLGLRLRAVLLTGEPYIVGIVE
jgi:transposase